MDFISSVFLSYLLRRPRITRIAPDTRVSAATPEAGLISGTASVPANARLERPAKSNANPKVFIWRFAYCLRRLRITRIAPETSVSAATPEAGLISGTVTPPANAELAAATKSNAIPKNFIRVRLRTRLHPISIMSGLASRQMRNRRTSTRWRALYRVAPPGPWAGPEMCWRS